MYVKQSLFLKDGVRKVVQTCMHHNGIHKRDQKSLCSNSFRGKLQSLTAAIYSGNIKHNQKNKYTFHVTLFYQNYYDGRYLNYY